jgi:hypothetical protein
MPSTLPDAVAVPAMAGNDCLLKAIDLGRKERIPAPFFDQSSWLVMSCLLRR